MNFNILRIKKYLLNCFLLLLPVLIWNIILADNLPDIYQPEIFNKDIPVIISAGENLLRIIVFVLPVIMMLSFSSKVNRTGLWIYLTGIIIYFTSWILQIYFSDSEWSKSIFGIMAPAYTTIIWFIGIGLIGNKSFIRFPYLSAIYIIQAFLFVIFHSLHVYIVFHRL